MPRDRIELIIVLLLICVAMLSVLVGFTVAELKG